MNLGIDKLKIAVVGMSSGAGAGFVSICLAGCFAGMGKYLPAVVEIGGGKLYDVMAIDKHFAGKEFCRCFDEIKNDKSIRMRVNLLYDINWLLKSPSEKEISMDLFEMVRMTNQARGDIVICKIPLLKWEEMKKLLADMDKIVAVIDPLPSGMLTSQSLLFQLQLSEMPVIYVINKMNGGVSVREMLRYLQIKNPFFIPLVEPANIYSAEYSCRFIYGFSPVKSKVEEAVNKIAREILSGGG